MADLNKIKDFLARTADSLKRSMDSGDAEGASRYEAMIERAVPLAEKAMAQAQPMPAPAAPQEGLAPPAGAEPVIPFGVKLADTRLKEPQPAPDIRVPGYQGGNPFKQSPFSLPPAPPGVATAPRVTTPEIPQMPTLSAPPQQGSLSELGEALGQSGIAKTIKGVGGKMLDFAFTGPGTEMAARAGAMGPLTPAAVSSNSAWANMKPKSLDMPSAPQSALAETPPQVAPGTEQQPTDLEAKDIFKTAIENPADDVEAEALKRIGKELHKRHPLEYIFTLLLLGAPRTFAMAMQDQDRYSKGVRDIYNKVRQEIADKKRYEQSAEFRDRETKANEGQAAASMLRALNAAKNASAAEGGKDVRSILNSPLMNPNDDLVKRAKEQMMLRLPKGQ